MLDNFHDQTAEQVANESFNFAVDRDVNNIEGSVYTINPQTNIIIRGKIFHGPLIALCSKLANDSYNIAILNITKNNWEFLPNVAADTLTDIEDAKNDHGPFSAEIIGNTNATSALLNIATILPNDLIFYSMKDCEDIIFLYQDQYYKMYCNGKISTIENFQHFNTSQIAHYKSCKAHGENSSTPKQTTKMVVKVLNLCQKLTAMEDEQTIQRIKRFNHKTKKDIYHTTKEAECITHDATQLLDKIIPLNKRLQEELCSTQQEELKTENQILKTQNHELQSQNGKVRQNLESTQKKLEEQEGIYRLLAQEKEKLNKEYKAQETKTTALIKQNEDLYAQKKGFRKENKGVEGQ